MRKSRLYSVIFIACALLLAFVYWKSSRSVPTGPTLSVAFIGLTNNPVRSWTPTRIEVPQGAT